MQEYKTKTQIKLGGGRKNEGSKSTHSVSHHRPVGPVSGPSEKFELNFFTKSDSPPDDMAYRKSGRIVATVDIFYSTFLLVAQLISLISGNATERVKKTGENGDEEEELEIVGNSDSFNLTQKQRETIAILVWMGMFFICILQLVVAGGTLGGTYERDGRKCIRNCKIWVITTIFLVFVLILQLISVFLLSTPSAHIVALILLIAEISLRSIGLFIIFKFIQELRVEFEGDGEDSEELSYSQLHSSPHHV